MDILVAMWGLHYYTGTRLKYDREVIHMFVLLRSILETCHDMVMLQHKRSFKSQNICFIESDFKYFSTFDAGYIWALITGHISLKEVHDILVGFCLCVLK